MEGKPIAGEPTYLEIGVADAARGRAFYGSLFGWEYEPLPSGDGQQTSTPKIPVGMHGGDAEASPYVFFGVADIDAAIERVRELGGSADGPREEGHSGRFAFCRDDQGSHFGLHQPPGRSRAETEAAHGEGTVVAVEPVREGFHTVTPYLMVREAERLIDFVKQAFGATELLRATGSAGGMHAEVRIGDSAVMIGGAGAPDGEMPAAIHLYLDDVDAVYERALRAGATSITEPADQAYGDRSAGVKDPFGNVWYIATHKKDVPL